MRHALATVATALLFVSGSNAIAAAEAKIPKLPGAERTVIERCLALTRNCQLSDGAVVQVAHADNPDAPALIVPYFAQHVALAWIAASAQAKHSQDVKRAGRWLTWCAMNQEDGGYWTHWEGTRRSYARTNECDAWDSSASMYLITLERYVAAGEQPSPAMISAGLRSLKCLEDLLDVGGLTIAKPSHRVMYLMDNVESFGGATAAAELFDQLGRREDRDRAGAVANRLKKAMHTFWSTEQNTFAWARHPDGAVDIRLEKLYPDGLAQLYGTAFVRPSGDIFAKTNQLFAAETTPAAAAGSERWLMAASRLGEKTAGSWRKLVVRDASEFTDEVYSFRAALVVLSLMEGATWMPSLVNDERTMQRQKRP